MTKSYRPVISLRLADELNGAFASGEPRLICTAIGKALGDFNVSEIARQTGLRRSSIYRAFGNAQPSMALNTTIGSTSPRRERSAFMSLSPRFEYLEVEDRTSPQVQLANAFCRYLWTAIELRRLKIVKSARSSALSVTCRQIQYRLDLVVPPYCSPLNSQTSYSREGAQRNRHRDTPFRASCCSGFALR